MLEHLVLGSHSDALAGDLLEEFKRRGSAAWYWRQVLAAIIVGLSRELGHQWKAAGFALIWTFVEYLIMRLWFLSATYRSIHPWTLRHRQPETFFLFMAVELLLHILVVWLGLVVYLALMGVLNEHRLTRGQLICLFFVMLEIGVYQSCWRVVLRITPPPLFLVVGRMPMFIGLLLSLCATLPSTAMKRAIGIPYSDSPD